MGKKGSVYCAADSEWLRLLGKGCCFQFCVGEVVVSETPDWGRQDKPSEMPTLCGEFLSGQTPHHCCSGKGVGKMLSEKPQSYGWWKKGEIEPCSREGYPTFPGLGRLCFRNGMSLKVFECPIRGLGKHLEIVPSRPRVMHDDLSRLGRNEAPQVLRTVLQPLMVEMGWQSETLGFATFKKIFFPKGSPSRNYLIRKPLELIRIDFFFVCWRARHPNPWQYIGGNGLFTHFFPQAHTIQVQKKS